MPYFRGTTPGSWLTQIGRRGMFFCSISVATLLSYLPFCLLLPGLTKPPQYLTTVKAKFFLLMMSHFSLLFPSCPFDFPPPHYHQSAVSLTADAVRLVMWLVISLLRKLTKLFSNHFFIIINPIVHSMNICA
ncbi:hypothetical protein, unlikely [Trypanosoma congolense IL3000]|uniref:Uncharacterized protein n=1 Tax=Trypanosoma congolense (strain IL3000) TaxID=1068625 RepID=F9WFL7_TRYCI|nr:hypothetical protein, unlikely [Trypanosoma congolense IL3000]